MGVRVHLRSGTLDTTQLHSLTGTLWGRAHFGVSFQRKPLSLNATKYEILLSDVYTVVQ